MSVGLASKSAAKSNKNSHPKYATLFLSWIPFKVKLFGEVNVKTIRKIAQIFVAFSLSVKFSEKLNFNTTYLRLKNK